MLIETNHVFTVVTQNVPEIRRSKCE